MLSLDYSKRFHFEKEKCTKMKYFLLKSKDNLVKILQVFKPVFLSLYLFFSIGYSANFYNVLESVQKKHAISPFGPWLYLSMQQNNFAKSSATRL